MTRNSLRFSGLFALLLAASVVSLGGCGDSPERPSDDAVEAEGPGSERVVAEVNGVPIPASRLDEVAEADRLMLGVAAPDMTEEESLELQREALHLVIHAELVYQAAVEKELSVPGDELEEQLHVARSQFATEEEFQDYLAAAGKTTERLREEVRRRLLMKAYAESVTGGLQIDPSRARQIFDEQSETVTVGDEVRVSQILVRIRPGDSAEKRSAAREKIEEAYKRAKAGEDFAELAREYSESPLAERGGDMGFLPRGRMLPEFDEAVFATPAGRITPIFETPHGLNVVWVVEHKEARERSFEEVRPGLMLVLAREQKNQVLREHIEELEQAATIRILDPRLQ
jgi:parvulin-like peptidyl-prolyl isomerase